MIQSTVFISLHQVVEGIASLARLAFTGRSFGNSYWAEVGSKKWSHVGVGGQSHTQTVGVPRILLSLRWFPGVQVNFT